LYIFIAKIAEGIWGGVSGKQEENYKYNIIGEEKHD